MRGARRIFSRMILARWPKKRWRKVLLEFVSTWNRDQFRRIVTGIVVIWLFGGVGLHLTEGPTNPAYATLGESLWNVWVALFSGLDNAPETPLGRTVAVVVIVAGVALAGLFTASIASILIERTLRSRDLSSLEMSDHLVLCHWSSRGLEWIREVHSNIVADKRPVVIIHDHPDDIELPDKSDDPAFSDVYIVKGDPANETILRRAKVPTAHSVVVLSDDRMGPHADGKTIVCCIAVRNVCKANQAPNLIVECQDPKFRNHMLKAGADEVISATDFGLRLLARAALFHGMTRVYQELLTVRRNTNEMYLTPVPPGLVGRTFTDAAGIFLADRGSRNACLLIGVYRGETMMLNPIGGEAGPLREADELILLSPVYPDLSRFQTPPEPEEGEDRPAGSQAEAGTPRLP